MPERKLSVWASTSATSASKYSRPTKWHWLNMFLQFSDRRRTHQVQGRSLSPLSLQLHVLQVSTLAHLFPWFTFTSWISCELNSEAREKGGELYCLRCHDKMGIPICGACRYVFKLIWVFLFLINLILPASRPIEERIVHALGKAWHVEVNNIDYKYNMLMLCSPFSISCVPNVRSRS